MPSQYRAEFDIPRDICYLNAAYMTPQPQRVLRAAFAGAERRAMAWEITPVDFFREVEILREAFARQVYCSPENIAIVPSASYGVSVAANNLSIEKDSFILVLADQFPSNYYPWQRLAERHGAELLVVAQRDGQSWADAILECLQEFGGRIEIAAMARHHWSTGASIDLDAVVGALREQGTRIVLDLTQTVGAFPIDISELSPDFMVAAGYKWLFCPYGVSFLYVDEQHFDGVPIEEAWLSRVGAEDFSLLASYTEHYQSGARRFDAGERSSFSNVAGAISALELLDEWGIDNISIELGKTNKLITDILNKNGFETMHPISRAPHFQSARLPNVDRRELTSRLIAEGVYVSQRGDRLRLAPHLYTDERDLARFEDSLRKAMI